MLRAACMHACTATCAAVHGRCHAELSIEPVHRHHAHAHADGTCARQGLPARNALTVPASLRYAHPPRPQCPCTAPAATRFFVKHACMHAGYTRSVCMHRFRSPPMSRSHPVLPARAWRMISAQSSFCEMGAPPSLRRALPPLGRGNSRRASPRCCCSYAAKAMSRPSTARAMS